MSAASSGGARTHGKHAFAFVLVTVLLDVLGLGIVIPVAPRLISAFVASTAEAAALFGWFTIAWQTMHLVFSPLLGALSDRFGRRPVILLSNFGLGVDYFLMATAGTLPLLFLGRIISGITSATFSVAGAYIADVTPPERRAASFGMMGSAFGFGFIVGPALGGFLGSVNPRLPFVIAGVLSLLNGLYGIFVLPESLPAERRKPVSLASVYSPGSFRMLGASSAAARGAAVFFLSMFANYVFHSVLVLYIAHRFGWAERETGLTLAGGGLAGVLVQALVIKRVVARFGELGAMRIGLGASIVSYLVIALAPSVGLFLAAMFLNSLWGLVRPSAQAQLSRELEGHGQGKLQGMLTSVTSIAGVLAPAFFSRAFAWGVRGDRFPGAPFVLGAVVLGVAFVLTLWARARPASERLEGQRKA